MMVIQVISSDLLDDGAHRFCFDRLDAAGIHNEQILLLPLQRQSSGAVPTLSLQETRPLSTTFERKRVVVVTRTRSHGLVTVTHLGSSRNHPPNEPSPLLTLTSHSSSLLAERLSVGSTADESPSLFSPHLPTASSRSEFLTSFRELTVKQQRLDYLPHDYTVENILTKEAFQKRGC